jgi:tetraacyldisaccharide 4'-kinase
MIKKCVRRTYLFLDSFWERSIDLSLLFFGEKVLFFILCFFELFYRAGFFFVSFFKRIFRQKKISFAKTVSIGNLSVGGTGKSVLSRFLVDELIGRRGALVLRGYGGSEKTMMVSDGNGMVCTKRLAGDEASLYAEILTVPVVAGSDRYRSIMFLKRECFRKACDFEYVVLDDAYQNYDVKKDIEILLLDARRPFENGHCLPAGRLREKDYSRADIVVLTHANKIGDGELIELRGLLSSKQVFTGKHVFAGLVDGDGDAVGEEEISGQKVCVLAGIGSFRQFVDSVQQLNAEVVIEHHYPDHYQYSQDDICLLQKQKNEGLFDIIVTTRKDWQRLEGLVAGKGLRIYIQDVKFEFLLKKEKEDFFSFFYDKIGWRGREKGKG